MHKQMFRYSFSQVIFTHKVTNNEILKSGAQEHYSEGDVCAGNSQKECLCHTVTYPDFYHMHPFL